jgi:galactonate dehydratase
MANWPEDADVFIPLNEEVIREHPQQRIFFNLFAENWHHRQAVQASPAEGSQLPD